MNENSKQDIAIEGLKRDVSWLRGEVSEIKKQVFNDIPHQINSIKDRVFYGLIIGITSILIMQIILQFFKN